MGVKSSHVPRRLPHPGRPTISHISGVMMAARGSSPNRNVVITISLPRGEKAANDA